MRKAIQVFSARLSQLEQFIRANGLEPPPLDANDAAMLERLIDTLQQPGTSPKGQLPSNVPELNPVVEKDDFLTEAISLPAPVCHELQKKDPRPEIEQGPVSLPGPPEFMFDMAQLTDSNQLQLPTTGLGDLFADYVDVDQLAALQDGNLAFPEWTTDFTVLNTMPLGMTYGWADLQIPYPDVNMSGTENSLDLHTSPHSSSGSDADAHASPDDGDSGGVISEISGRMGSLQVSDDGELRYFGATSNLILRDDIAHFDQWAEPNIVRSRVQRLLDSAGLGQTVDAALEEHLINLYFTWQDPTFHVVDRELYRQSRAMHGVHVGHSSYLSETLINAM